MKLNRIDLSLFRNGRLKKYFLIMRLTSLLTLFLTLQMSASVWSQTMSVKLKNSTLQELFVQIEKNSNYRFFYNNDEVDVNQRISIDAEEKTVGKILSAALGGTSYSFKEMENKLILIERTRVPSNIPGSNQQQKSVSGTVTDSSGDALPGVSVVVKGTTTGTITDTDGNFSLSKIPENSILQFSFVGMKTQEVTVGNKTTFRIVLADETVGLEEVVAVGYGTMKKSDLTSAVSSVKGTVISSVSKNNIRDVLQGKIAGVDIEESRYPGEDRGISIRGVRSLNAGNNPLIIIDGVPGSLSSVNSNDVESIEVLKDAASAAVYGSQGANGVILVTTKRSKGTLQVTYNGYYGVNVPHMIKMQSGDEYAQFRRDGYNFANGWNNPAADEKIFYPKELPVLKNKNYIDWQDLLYRSGNVQSHYINVTGGSEKTKVNMSLKYDDEEGYYRTNEDRKYNLSASIDQELKKWWHIGLSTRINRLNSEGFKTYGTEFMYMTPLAQPYDENGDIIYFPAAQNTSGYNILANYVPGQYVNDKQTNNVNLLIYSDLKLSRKLSFRTNFGYIFNGEKTGYFNGKNSYEGKGVKSNSGRGASNSDQYTLTNILSYENTINRHHFIVDLVSEIQNYKSDYTNASGYNQPVDYTSYYNLASNTENITISSGYSSWSLASGLGRLRYDYAGKYFFNFSLRDDGSSRLAKGNQWSYFPSGGIAWRISEENFIKAEDWIDNLKLRVSYGTVGNTAISPYQTLASLNQKAYLFGESSSSKFFVYSPSALVNKGLGWEISRTLNTGIDFSFFKNRISGYVEMYDTQTSNLLLQRTIPTFNGYSSIWDNIGKTSNSGYEISLTGDLFSTKNFSWQINGMFSRNKEKIVELIGGNDLPNNGWFIGKPLSVYYNYEKIGIWQLGEEAQAAKYNAVPGDIKLKDQNDDGKYSAVDDKIILGQTRPKWIASLGSNVRYRNFDLSFNINVRWGYLLHPSAYGSDLTMDGQKWIPKIDYWTPDNPTNQYQKADALRGYDSYRDTNGYMKGDHIKLQNITLGYNLKNLVIRYVKIQDARFFVQARNLCYLYRAASEDITPEASDMNYTIPSSYNLGINVTF